MDESREDAYLVDLITAVFRRWWIVALATLCGGAAGLVLALFMPAEYEAVGSVVIAPPKFKTELTPSILSVEAYRSLLLSDGLLADVQRTLEKKAPKSEPPSIGFKWSAEVELVDQPGRKHAPVLILKARHEDPAAAAEIVNTWLKEFRSLAASLTVSQAATMEKFIREQFAEARQKLSSAEDAMREFKSKNSIELLDRLQKQILTGIAECETELRKTRREEKRLAEDLSLIEEQIAAQTVDGRWAGEAGVKPSGGGGRFGAGVRRQILDLVRRYENCRKRLEDFAARNDPEGLERLLQALSDRIRASEGRLRELDTRIPAVRAELSAVLAALKDVPSRLAFTRSPKDESIWESILGGKGAEWTKLRLSDEEPNPLWTTLKKNEANLQAAISSMESEKQALSESLSGLREEHKRTRAELQTMRNVENTLKKRFTAVSAELSLAHKQYLALLSERRSKTVLLEHEKRHAALLENELASLRKEHLQLLNRLETARQKMSELTRLLEVNRRPYDLLKEKVEEARIAKAEFPEDVRIASPAVPPDRPVWPQKWTFATIGAVLAFIVSGAWLTLREAARLVRSPGESQAA